MDPITVTTGPWRFLRPLSGEIEADRNLISLTRKDELRVVISMVAASSVSILYAFSGNGKTSLINAGVVPFFKTPGYMVFRTRPRPSWSTYNPSQAFKDCVLKDLRLPLFGAADLKAMDHILGRIKLLPKDSSTNIEEDLKKIIAKIQKFKIDAPEKKESLIHLKNRVHKPIPEFVSEIRSQIESDTRLIFICDQFEELFVHYGNTPQLRNFAEELGILVADNSMKAHLLFSMREDWVGSMIEFRDVIPDIFSYYFKLNPIQRSRAKDAITVPASSVGMEFEDEAIEKILDDLVEAYSINQQNRYSEVKLTLSPSNDPYIELPALQVVMEKLWQAYGYSEKLTLEHYELLKNQYEKPRVTLKDSTTDLKSPDTYASPAQAVLDNYVLDILGKISKDGGESQEVDRDLLLDCLILLTDKSRHRRALPESVLLDEIRQIRPAELDLQIVDKTLLRAAIEPLEKSRLVVSHVASDMQNQYELAHDFAVRSVVKAWRQLDRKRTTDIAILSRQRIKKDEKLSQYISNEERWLKVLQWTPASLILVVALLSYEIYFFGLFQHTGAWVKEAPLFSTQYLILSMVISAAMVVIGFMTRQNLGITMGIIFISLGIVSYSTVKISMILSYWIIAAGTSSTVLLFYPKLIVQISRRTNGSLIVQRIFTILWSEFIDILSVAIVISIAAILSGLTVLVSPNDADFKNRLEQTSKKAVELSGYILSSIPKEGDYKKLQAVAYDIEKAGRRLTNYYSTIYSLESTAILLNRLEGNINLLNGKDINKPENYPIEAIARFYNDIVMLTEASSKIHQFYNIKFFACILVAASIILCWIFFSALWILRRGKTIGFHWSGFVIKKGGIYPPTFYRAILRQFLFFLWTCLNALAFIPWLVIGPVVIKKSKDKNNIYDILAGTVPVCVGLPE